MQKNYLTPALHILAMEQEDVITGSVTYSSGMDEDNKDHFIDWSEKFN